MATNPRTLAPNTSLHRTPAAAPPSPVSSKPLGASKKHLIATLMAVLAAACAGSRRDPHNVPVANLPELGVRFHPPETAVGIVSRGKMGLTYGVFVAGVHFNVMVEATDSTLRSISTQDLNFSTPEGARIGDSISRLIRMPGRWVSAQSTYLLESGWLARFYSEKVFQFEKVADGA